MEAVLDFLLNNLEIITSLLFGLVGIFFLKTKKVLKEVGDVLTTLVDALEDDKLSKEEVREIAKEFMDIIDLFKKKDENS